MRGSMHISGCFVQAFHKDCQSALFCPFPSTSAPAIETFLKFLPIVPADASKMVGVQAEFIFACVTNDVVLVDVRDKEVIELPMGADDFAGVGGVG